MAQLLRSHGVQVVEAGSAEEAHGLALFGQLQCVIIDLGAATASICVTVSAGARSRQRFPWCS